MTTPSTTGHKLKTFIEIAAGLATVAAIVFSVVSCQQSSEASRVSTDAVSQAVEANSIASKALDAQLAGAAADSASDAAQVVLEVNNAPGNDVYFSVMNGSPRPLNDVHISYARCNDGAACLSITGDAAQTPVDDVPGCTAAEFAFQGSTLGKLKVGVTWSDATGAYWSRTSWREVTTLLPKSHDYSSVPVIPVMTGSDAGMTLSVGSARTAYVGGKC